VLRADRVECFVGAYFDCLNLSVYHATEQETVIYAKNFNFDVLRQFSNYVTRDDVQNLERKSCIWLGLRGIVSEVEASGGLCDCVHACEDDDFAFIVELVHQVIDLGVFECFALDAFTHVVGDPQVRERAVGVAAVAV